MLLWLPIAYALLFWWFSTGVIFYLDSLPMRTFKWSMAAATVLFAVALICLWQTSGDRSLFAVYAAFSSAVVAWGWQEMSLYMGYVTGPRKHRCPTGCNGWRHFGHAIAANLWHEIAIITSAALIVVLTWNAENHAGVWAFLLLWGMHLSARINVFLGVRNVSEDFVPPHMDVLKGFLTRKPMNLLFPVSVTVATVITVMLFTWASAESDIAARTEYLLLASLAALGVLEHWLLVLPLPVEKLFAWSLSRRSDNATDKGPPAHHLGNSHSHLILTH